MNIQNMPSIALCWLVLLGIPGAVGAQADRPEVPKHTDPVVQATQDHINRLCEAHNARLAKIDSAEALRRETDAARKQFLEILDLDLDAPRQPPGVTRVGVLEFPDYRIEKIILESAPGVPVPCNLYVPTSGPARKPALISPHGHSGRDRPVYQNALQRFAKAGFIVLAKDGWGKQERRGTGHGESGGQLALTGTELMALELFDNVRSLDYLVTRPDVDPDRLGMAGLSGGGSQTLYTAAIEPRLKAASPTCAVTTFRSDLADTTMCVCELAHDVLTIGDHGLFLAMAFPRPLLVVNGTRDAIFPIAGARFSSNQARSLYAAAGRGDAVEFAEYDEPHAWTDPMIDRQIHWFRRLFNMPELATLPPGDGPRDEDTLNCYPNRDLPAGSLTLSSVNRSRMKPARAETAATGRSLDADRARLAGWIRARWSGEPALPARVTHRDFETDSRHNTTRQRLSWPSGLGGSVSAVVSRLPAARAGDRVVIHLEDRDQPEPQLERLYWDDRVRGAATVVTLAFTGASLEPRSEGQVGSALLSSGRSLLAERVRDVLVAIEVLREQKVITDLGKVMLMGHGFDGVALLVASASSLAPVDVILDRTPITYNVGSELDFATPRLLAPPYHWTILPGLATHHDLSDLLELPYPRKVVLAHPRDAAQAALGREELDQILARLTRTDRSHIDGLTREHTRAEVFRKLADRP